MKKININISYNEEKMNALRLFLSQKNLELEDEIVAVLDVLFKKQVPTSVREFIEMKELKASTEKKNTGSKP